jgi:glutathione peroxidase
MRQFFLYIIFFFLGSIMSPSLAELSIYHLPINKADGTVATLEPYAGKVLLIVNVASQCGFTPQYKKLQTLQEKYLAKGLQIIAFPSNQFADQEPGTNKAIQHFAKDKFKVTFPVYAKIEVKGANQAPIYQWIRHNYKSFTILPLIPWNFTKFLIDRQGRVVERFLPTDSFASIEKSIKSFL